MIDVPLDAIPPPPRAVKYRPGYQSPRFGWAIFAVLLALAPVVAAFCGLSYHRLGATPPPATAKTIDAQVTGYYLDYNGDAQMTFSYKVGNNSFVRSEWVPRSYYDQMVNYKFSPITLDDPNYPTNFYIGPPRGHPGVYVWVTYIWAEAIAFVILCIWGYYEFGRVSEYRLLRHGWAATGTVIKVNTDPGNAGLDIQFATPHDMVTARVPFSEDPGCKLMEGDKVVMVYSPNYPSLAKPIAYFKDCELC